MNNIRKPDHHKLSDQSVTEKILRWILSNIKGTIEYSDKEMKKHIKY